MLQKLAYQSEAAIYNDYGIAPLIQTQRELKDEFKDHVFLKALDANVIVGCVRARKIERCCHIGRLIVAPDRQHQGLGRRLMAAIEAYFDDSARFEVFTGHKSKRNLSLYRRLGYVEVRRQEVAAGLTFVFLSKPSDRTDT